MKIQFSNLMNFSKNYTNTIAIQISTLPKNMTADHVFAALRLAPLLHFTSKVSPQQLQQMHSLQAVLDLNNLSVETLFRNVSLLFFSITSFLISNRIVKQLDTSNASINIKRVSSQFCLLFQKWKLYK